MLSLRYIIIKAGKEEKEQKQDMRSTFQVNQGRQLTIDRSSVTQ